MERSDRASGEAERPAPRSGRSRIRRIARWVLVLLALAPLVAWLAISIVVKATVAREAPFTKVLELVGGGLFGSLKCALGGCDAELIDGMTIATFDDHLTEGTLVALDVDERGRVLVAEAHRMDAGVEDNRRHDWLEADLAARTLDDRIAYQRDAIARGAVEGADHFTRESDRLVMLEDADGDGRADRRAELASWNEEVTGLVAGVEAREGTIWVASIPSIYRIADADGDGVAESTEELVRGFGVKTSLTGHDLHGLAWGPDGKLYVSIGDRGYSIARPDGSVLEPPLGPGRGAVFRMNPDGSDLEVFATGLRNPQELAFDDEGNLFTGDYNGDGGDPARVVYVVEGGDSGWAMPYQSLSGDYVRGPWMAERLFDLQHETQPAWILPPVAQIANGPSGFVHYPGLGLPARYANHFFLCDYAYVYGQSGIWSFSLEPRGAGFELVDRHAFIWSVLTPDFDFSWDGRMFAARYDQMGDRRGIAVFEHPESRADPRVAELARIAATKMASHDTDDLIGLLDFPDQRLRLRAQFELANRRAIAPLVALARDEGAALQPRLHAVWALGQIGDAGLEALAEATGWATSASTAHAVSAAPAVPAAPAARGPASDVLRAQLARVAGEARSAAWLAWLRDGLGDPAPRVRFFAAQALGRLGDGASVEPLVALLRENADRDVFLRHAAVFALHRIGALDAVLAHRDDPSRAVRLAVLLVLRHAGDSRVAAFLGDPDPQLVVEAARAIYDGPIDGAMPALAALAPGLAPAAEGDRQTAEALHRRVIGANVRLRTEAGAAALARYAADARQREDLRALALEQLARYAEPPVRDLTIGFHRPLAPVDRGLVARVLYGEGRALVESSLGARALEVAGEYGVSPLSDAELVALSGDGGVAARERVAALTALRDRALASSASNGAGLETGAASGEAPDAGAARGAAERAIADPDAAVRSAARDLLLALDPEAGLVAELAAAESGVDAGERQRAWRRLGAIPDARAREAILRALAAWEAGALAEPVALDVIEAGVAQGGLGAADLAARARSALAGPPGSSGSPGSLVASRRWARAGGDPVAGRAVFQTTGDCQRCHGDPEAAESGHGGAPIGPVLSGIAAKGADYLLESVLAPDAQIAAGFPSPSNMPPIGLALEPRALRDLVAYLMGLDGRAGRSGGARAVEH